LPFSSKKLKEMLAFAEADWSKTGDYSLLKEGHQLGGEPKLLFEKIEDSVIETQIKKLNDKKKSMELATTSADPSKPEVSFDEFSKIDMRIGKIVKAEAVEKSKKLLKLQIDTGIDVRTILSGIAEHFKPEEIVGKQVTVLVNLAPRKIMGVESQGMLLTAQDKDGKLRMLQPSEIVAPGSKIS
jgi:methionyl-tRNA synthetase